MARLVAFQGHVVILRAPDNRSRTKAWQEAPILPDDVLEVPEKGTATVRYTDGSRLDLGPGASLRVARHGGDTGPGPDGVPRAKKIVLNNGSLKADVARQPDGLPMILCTPQAVVRVVGTRFTLTAEGPSTRLELYSGKVRLTRREDGAAVDVAAGQCVVALPESPLEVRSMRAARDVIALYHFNEGRGNLVRDVSGFGDPLPLRIANVDSVDWIPGGLLVHDPTTIATDTLAYKITQACKRSRELTVEAWIQPLDEWPLGGHLVSLSANAYNVDVVIDKEAGAAGPIEVRIKSSKTFESGVSMRGGALPPRLTHVVYTRGASGRGTLYLNGAKRGEHALAGSLDNWDHYRLAIAGDARGKGSWRGEYYYLAFYSRALTDHEVAQNYQAGSE
jgi:hypothetical protein